MPYGYYGALSVTESQYVFESHILPETHGEIVAEYAAYSVFSLYSAEVLTLRNICYAGEIFLVFCQFHDALSTAIREAYVLDAIIITRAGVGVGDAIELELFGRFTTGDSNLTKCHDVVGAAQTYLGG